MAALRSGLYNTLFCIVLAVLAIPCVPLLLGPWQGVTALSRFWIGINLAMLRGVVGLDHQVVGRENLPAGPFILAAKHQSAWDTLAFNVILRDPVFVVKRELFFIPFFGWYLWRAGMIGVDRSAGSKALRKMLRDAKNAAAAGRPVMIFPEGTRSAPGDKKPYQPGVAALYGQLGLPVVPVALNSGRFWGRRSFVKTPGTITVSFLPPIAPGLDRREFLAELERRIEDECRRIA